MLRVFFKKNKRIKSRMIINPKAKKIALSGLFATFSLLFSFMGHYLVIPMFLGFKLDISDFPIFTSTLLFGPSYGYVTLIVVNFIKMFFFSTSGWPGFFMRITSIISVFFFGLYFKYKKRLIFYSTLSILILNLIKVPLSCLFWVIFKSMPIDQLFPLIFSTILPYNLVKSIINTFISIYFYKNIRELINDKKN